MHDYFSESATEDEVGRRVKRHLRVQDQAGNMKRILFQQKHYKMLLVQDLLDKDRKARDLSEFRKSAAAAASVYTMRNN